MKLKSLEMVGFKSFADRIHLAFPEGITAVVGPNGCGKSNIVDSILWAIGERSAKHLRGKLMEDVIFGGTDGRKPVGMAEVNLTFRNGASAPAAFGSYNEITITRRLFRSGESEYLINKVPCRLRDITDLFLDSGLGVDGYSVVEQGRVESLIKANPQDRRFLIEEAAGIAKYKERKRLALLKMEATQQNLLRIQDIIAEVKRQILTLERQVKRAEEYKTIRKEVKEIELRLAMQEYAELSEKGDGARGYLQALRERETGISSQSAQKEALIEEMRLHGMEEEEKLRTLQQSVFELGRKIQKLESEAEFLRREDENLQRQEGQALFEVRENLGVWRQANRDRRQLVQSRESLEEEYRLNGENLRALESHFNEVKVNYQSFLETSEEEKGKLIDTLTHLTSLKNRLSHLDERREDLQKRIRSNEEEVKKVSSKEAELEESFRTSTGERETLLLVRSMLQEEKVGWEGELDALKEVFKQKQVERREKEDALRQDRSRYLSLKELQENFEGYDKGVKSILLQKKETAEKWDGILGTVADILEPEPQYEVPLEAVLGQRLQYLIAENNRDAVEAIDYLKRGSLGRGSFLPREVPRKAEGCSTQASLFSEVKEGGKPLPLMGFVNVKEGYAPLAEFLIGDVGVVQRWEEAFQLIHGNGHFNIFVTLDGDVIERTGIVSGGSLDQGLGLLERRRVIRQLEGMIQEKEVICQTLHGEEQRRMEEIEEREARLEKRKQEIQDKELELIHKERDLEQLAKDRDQCKREMEVLHFEKSQLEEEARELEKEKEEVSLKMGAGETMKQQGEEQVQSLKKKVEDLREEADRLGAEITERKVFLASLEEKQRGMETQRINLSNGQRTLKEQILRKIEAIRKGREERTSLAARSAQSQKELEESLVDYHRQEEILTGQKEKVEVYLNELKESEASAKYLRQELDSVRQKIHEEEIRTSEIQLKLQHLQDSMRERYGTTLSASIGNLSDEFPREEKLARLEELKKSLEGFGEVNLMALEEYQELKQRHDFLTEQQTDLHQALDALKKAIFRINRTTTKRFLETFHLVNEKFKEVFVRLFKGGQASLVLLDEQDPSTTGVEIVAQPPGKKLQSIDLLSGGEKALVAIALIFGLFMIKPTPFCLLDEVDAPLDDANINRFIELVKDFSKTSQFVFITHNKKTMETANTLYGITMETPGVSKAVSVRLTEN
jgi:chromosome segregation protein